MHRKLLCLKSPWDFIPFASHPRGKRSGVESHDVVEAPSDLVATCGGRIGSAGKWRWVCSWELQLGGFAAQSCWEEWCCHRGRWRLWRWHSIFHFYLWCCGDQQDSSSRFVPTKWQLSWLEVLHGDVVWRCKVGWHWCHFWDHSISCSYAHLGFTLGQGFHLLPWWGQAGLTQANRWSCCQHWASWHEQLHWPTLPAAHQSRRCLKKEAFRPRHRVRVCGLGSLWKAADVGLQKGCHNATIDPTKTFQLAARGTGPTRHTRSCWQYVDHPKRAEPWLCVGIWRDSFTPRAPPKLEERAGLWLLWLHRGSWWIWW